MKTAFAVWNNRIAPVFDVAREVIIVESGLERMADQTQVKLLGDLPSHKALRLSQLGADHLVCGAISRALKAMLTASGIRVIPFVAGDVKVIIDAWDRRVFERSAFSMPRCRRCSSRRLTDPKQDEVRMVNDNRNGSMGLGNCVCQKCGHTELHEREKPCLQKNVRIAVLL